MQTVAIVIVNWNGYKDTSVCLESILKMKTNSVKLETIVVDNGSTNDSVQVFSKKFSWVTLLKQQMNLGFSGGNNVGMRHAIALGVDYIWLLNNDTIVDPNALKLIDAFADPQVGVAGSKIYFAPGHEYHLDRYTKGERGKVFWFAGGHIDWNNMYASHKGVDEVDHGQYDKIIDTPYITGCSMMIRRKVVETIGYLDDRLYLYLEDLDYCLRAQLHGYAIRYYPSSVIWHVNAGSSGGAGNELHEYYITRNRLFIGFRYAPIRTKFALFREAVKFTYSNSSVKRRAVLDALFGRWGKQYEPKKFT